MELVHPEALPRFQSLLRRASLSAGDSKPEWAKRLYYVALARAVASHLLQFFAQYAAKHLRHREKWIGWTEAQRRKRFGAGDLNNARFLILPHGHYPNLATRGDGVVVSESGCRRIGRRRAYAHPVWLAESFVDTQLFRGTAYKASGWTELGPA